MPGSKVTVKCLWVVVLVTGCGQTPSQPQQRDSGSQRNPNQLVFRLARSQDPSTVIQQSEQLLADASGRVEARVQAVAAGLFAADFAGQESSQEKLRELLIRELQAEWVGFGVYGPDQEPILPSGRVLVKFADDAGWQHHHFLMSPTVFPYHEFKWGTTAVEVSEDPFLVVENLRQQPGVEYAEVDLLRHIEPHFYPNDPLFSRQWHLDNTGQQGALPGADVNAPEAWEITRGAPEIVIAIIDSGVSGETEDLQDCKLLSGLDVTDLQDADGTFPYQRHGTSCAGVAAGNAGNGLGVAGLCPRCRVLPIRLILEDPRSDFTATRLTLASDIAMAFEFAVNNGADILSNSWGITSPQPLLQTEQNAIEHAFTQGRNGLGSPVLFSAGNSDRPTKYFPFAAHPQTMAIAASNDQDRRAYYSNYGDKISVAAPSSGGVTTGIWTTDVPKHGGYNPGHAVYGDRHGNYTNSFGGTSSSCPLVAGLAGLVLSVDPTLTAVQVQEIIEQTADKIDPQGGDYQPNGHSWKYGFGRINAAAAVAEAQTRPGAGSTGAPCSVGCQVDYCLPDPFADDYCSRTCTTNEQCPDGFECADTVTRENTDVRACVREFFCEQRTEICGDQFDNDGDGLTDEDCTSCAGETFDGRCDNGDVVYCESEMRGPEVDDCDPSNACGRWEERGIYACQGCGDAERRCEGNVLFQCRIHKSGAPQKNIYVGAACPEECASDSPHCVCEEGREQGLYCDGNDLVYCYDGVTTRFPCTEGCTPTYIGTREFGECTCNADEDLECQGDELVWCDTTGTHRYTCPHDCDEIDTGNGLVPYCLCEQGFDPLNGECQGSTLRYCSYGEIVNYDCPEACGEDSDGRSTCICANGMAIGERRCKNDTTLQTCFFGETQERSCSCEVTQMPLKYYPNASSEPLALCGCPNSTLFGRCEGETLVYCLNGEEIRIDCEFGCGIAPGSDGAEDVASCVCKDVPMVNACDEQSSTKIWHCMRDGTKEYGLCGTGYECGCDAQSREISCTSDVASDPSDCDPQCPSGTSHCGGNCVDTQISQRHCGVCERECDHDELCESGACETAPTFNVFGSVIDSATQAPVPGAALILSELSRASSASDGSYSLSGARSGDHFLSVYADGYQATAMTVVIQQADLPLDVSLRKIGIEPPAGTPNDGQGPADDNPDGEGGEGDNTWDQAVGYPCAGTTPINPLWVGIWFLWRRLHRRRRG